ncbi:MAG: HD domain-containing protein [Desulfovibrio sp.]
MKNPLQPFLPPLDSPPAPPGERGGTIPDYAACVRLWDAYDMPRHIRAHSTMVARVATHLAVLAKEAGLDVNPAAVRASALLHDIAKAYTIDHGGNHSQLGASWVMDATGSPALAHGVMHHVYWPFDLDLAGHVLPLAVIYGDKRVAHDRIVSLDNRFQDLLERYGKTTLIRERIAVTHEQAVEVERLFSKTCKVNLSEDTFDRGRMVD